MRSMNQKKIKQLERNLIKNFKGTLEELKRELAHLYEKYGDQLEDEMYKYNRMEKLDKTIREHINELYSESNKEIARTLRESYRETSKSVAYIVEMEIGSTLKPITRAFEVNKTINEKMAGLNWAERQGKHRADLIYELQKEIKQGLDQGETYSTVAKRLTRSMNTSVGKANTIARTETNRVMATAQKDTLDKIRRDDVEMYKVWNTVSDERVRSEHAEMDGVEVPYDDDFTMPNGAKGFGPQLIGDHNDINCRCFQTIKFVKQ